MSKKYKGKVKKDACSMCGTKIHNVLPVKEHIGVFMCDQCDRGLYRLGLYPLALDYLYTTGVK